MRQDTQSSVEQVVFNSSVRATLTPASRQLHHAYQPPHTHPRLPTVASHMGMDGVFTQGFISLKPQQEKQAERWGKRGGGGSGWGGEGERSVTINTTDESDKGQCYQTLTAALNAWSERQRGWRWRRGWSGGEKGRWDRDPKLLAGGRKLAADNLCVIYLCVMCIWVEYRCVKSRLDCLEVLHHACPDWTQKHSFAPIMPPLLSILCALFSPSPSFRWKSDFLLSKASINLFPVHKQKRF